MTTPNSSTDVGPEKVAVTRLYQLLLAYARRALPATDRQVVQTYLDHPRWQAHAASIRFLDLDRVAAEYDAKQIRAMAEEVEGQRGKTSTMSPYCRQVAAKDGQALAGPLSADWQEHLETCAFCRRWRREYLARQEAAKLNEVLLRDALLRDSYLKDLQHLTQLLRNANAIRLVLCREANQTALLVEKGDQKVLILQPPAAAAAGNAQLNMALGARSMHQIGARRLARHLGTRAAPTPINVPEGDALTNCGEQARYARTLDHGHGSLGIAFTTNPTTVTCSVTFTRRDALPPWPTVTLRLATDGEEKASTADDTESHSTVALSVPLDQAQAGQGVTVTALVEDAVVADHWFVFCPADAVEAAD